MDSAPVNTELNGATAAHDVLVIGAGPAGLAAAWRAASEGQKVTVVDDNPSAGGQIWRGAESGSKENNSKNEQPAEAQHWFERIRSVNIRFIRGARIFQQVEPGKLLAETAREVIELSYNKLVLATGARERFLPFPGWTLPNVVGAGGLQALVKTGLSIEGKRIVIAGSGPLLLAVAAYLQKHRAAVLLVAEQASALRLARFSGSLIGSSKLTQAIELKRRLRATRYLTGCWPVAAHGDKKLASVTLRRGSKRWQVECDYLACGYHLVPNLELAELLGCEIADGVVSVDEFQETSVRRVYAAGETTGIGGLELSLIEGEIAGLSAAGKHDEARKLFSTRTKHRRFARILHETFALRNELRHPVGNDTIVCRCEDVSFGRLTAHQSWRAAKLQTRCGMGPCQGRVCGPAVEFLFGWKAESVRPPVFPVLVESMLERR